MNLRATNGSYTDEQILTIQKIGCGTVLLLLLVYIVSITYHYSSPGPVVDGTVESVSEMQMSDNSTFAVELVTVKLEGSNELHKCNFNADEDCKQVQQGDVVTLELNNGHGRIDSIEIRTP